VSVHLDPRRIHAIADGEIDGAARRHLDDCGSCRRALEREHILRDARRLSAAPQLPTERSRAMADSFSAALASGGGATVTRKGRRAWIAAAGLAAALLAGWLVLGSESPAPTSGTTAITTAPPEILPEAVLPLAPVEVVAAPPNTLQVPDPEPAAPMARRGTITPREAEPSPGRALATGPGASGAESDNRARPGRASRAEALRRRGDRQLQRGRLEQAADTYVDSLASTTTPDQLTLTFAAYKRLISRSARGLEPRALVLRAERIAGLALPAPYDEEGAYLACESALAAQSYEAAYRLCSTYLERFPRGPRARDVAYLTATVARVQLGDCRAAVVRYKQALMFSGVLQSFNDEAYLGRALCHEQLGELDAARADLDLYLHKRPARIEAAQVRALAERLGRAPQLPTTRDR